VDAQCIMQLEGLNGSTETDNALKAAPPTCQRSLERIKHTSSPPIIIHIDDRCTDAHTDLLVI